MNQTIADTCHCIVRNPDKAKFLVVKHDETWAPPVLMFPHGPIDFQANQINQGMLQKYGLKTRVLRPVINLPNYHCIEMELAAVKATKKLQAVWVDQAEYLRTRTPPGDLPDPFEMWFKEQESGKAPDKRPPFHRPGWFEQADHWIHFQLDSLGIQVKGSVEQYRQGWNSSCVLRVSTSQGWVFFKAGYEDKPGEATVTEALAQRWPDQVFSPLAVDTKRNWMLNRDFRAEGDSVLDLQHLPDFARALAALQLESSKDIAGWKALGCREVGMDDFLQFCEQPEIYKHRWQEGGGGLSEKEWSDLQLALQGLAQECRTLADTDLPSALVHPDFRDDNLIFADGQYHILDWSEVIIAHPFLVLGRVLTDHRATLSGRNLNPATMPIGDELRQQVVKAYLDVFAAELGEAELEQALRAVERLDRLWMMMRILHRLDWIEVASPHYYKLIGALQTRARRLIAADAD